MFIASLVSNFNTQIVNKLLLDNIGADYIDFACDNIVYVKLDQLIRCLMILRDLKDLQYQQLVDISVIDYLNINNDNERFEICYHLLSHQNNARLIVKIKISEEDVIPSVHDVFVNSIWYEQEAWDLFGIKFDLKTNMTRILCDYNFQGHALRKDFNLSGYSEVYLNKQTNTVEYRKLNLEQNYRNFDFLSPWEGDWNHLLKSEENANSK